MGEFGELYRGQQYVGSVSNIDLEKKTFRIENLDPMLESAILAGEVPLELLDTEEDEVVSILVKRPDELGVVTDIRDFDIPFRERVTTSG